MSLLAQHRPDATFGRGGDEPYARALLNDTPELLVLHEVGRSRSRSRLDMDFVKWNTDADDVDRLVLKNATGPVLDIGCGPGRMVRAAGELGLDALGLDVSPAVVARARRDGVAVAEGSVFDRVPAEGLWQSALLLDGNIGIGGDVPTLLARCRQILAAAGRLLIELDSDDSRNRAYTATLVDGGGSRSAVFPWAEMGLIRLRQIAPAAGFTLDSAWTQGRRRFCRLTRA